VFLLPSLKAGDTELTWEATARVPGRFAAAPATVDAGGSRGHSEAGVLVIEDCEIAAVQFMEASHAALFKPIVFNFAPAPSRQQIERGVRIAVKVFLAAYGAPAKS